MSARYEIDAAMMGGEWQGDLDSFADVLQELAGDKWEIVAVNGMHNGADNRNHETDERTELPEDVWLGALDKHAEKYPEMWRRS